jgi:hypothetical protein
MATKLQYQGKLIKDISGNYWYQDIGYEGASGLYFDLTMLMRVSGEDENGLNTRINDANAGIHKEGYAYYCTLGLVPKQAQALVDSGWDTTFYSKTRFFLWDSSFTGGIGSAVEVYGAMTTDFIWVDNDHVYTQWSANNLAYRFPRTSTAPKVDTTTDDDTSTDTDDTTDTSDTTDDTTSSTTGTFTISVTCPSCGEVIKKTF